MESPSIIHWLILILIVPLILSPALGVFRGVRNGSALHAILSAFLPIYGLVYFFAARRV